MNKPDINIVWFKRDLRLSDHEPIQQAFSSGLPTLMIYNFEPMLLDDPHHSDRHWQFVWQSLLDLNDQLKPYGGKIYHFSEPMLGLLDRLFHHYQFELYSHQEIGLKNTYDRDKSVLSWCQAKKINWHESPTGAVIRGLKNRQGWESHWYKTIGQPFAKPTWANYTPVTLKNYTPPYLKDSINHKNDCFQKGGPRQARETLKSFFQNRALRYRGALSSPSASQVHCSRLSPYLSWGNMSIRQVYQYTDNKMNEPGYRTQIWQQPLTAFKARLHWHCHFIQKFESQCSMEFEPLNPGYRDFPYRSDNQIESDVERWLTGQTGIPIVDACMRCLIQTGYINFRMRAMLVSFITHHLNIHWKQASLPLARYFLDFEPGIHYPQIQMQASVTGLNIVRTYNPVKQSKDKDPEGIFIKTWCPELSALTASQVHEPWRFTHIKSTDHLANSEKNYPTPMLDLVEAAQQARERLWGYRRKESVQRPLPELIHRHINPGQESKKNA